MLNWDGSKMSIGRSSTSLLLLLFLIFWWMFTHSHQHPAPGQGGVSQPAGGRQVWHEPSHQPQAQRDLDASGVQQHQPRGAAFRVGQSQPAENLAAWHEGIAGVAFMYRVLSVLGLHYLETYSHTTHSHSLTQIGKTNLHSPDHVWTKAHAWVNVGQAFLLQYPNSMQPKGACVYVVCSLYKADSLVWNVTLFLPLSLLSNTFCSSPFGFNHCHFTLPLLRCPPLSHLPYWWTLWLPKT